MKKPLYIFFGIICVILGAIGIPLPVLPTTPFLLLATYFFVRSSPKLYEWLLNNKVFGKYLIDFYENRPIPIKQKLISIGFLWLGLGSTFYFAELQLWLILLLIFIGICVTIHISTLGMWRKRKSVTRNAPTN